VGLITIRPALTEQDVAEAIGTFFKEMQAFAFSPLLSEVTDYIYNAITGARAGDPVLVAEVDGRTVGLTLWTNAVAGSKQEGDLMAHGTWVDPEYRKTGLGSELRKEAERVAKEAGYTRIVGSVHPANEAGLKSLAGRGWTTEAYIVVKEL